MSWRSVALSPSTLLVPEPHKPAGRTLHQQPGRLDLLYLNCSRHLALLSVFLPLWFST